MAAPALPSQGSTAWHPWAQWMHNSVAAPQSYLNVKDYGAVGDGATDDSAAFAAVTVAARSALRTSAPFRYGDKFGSVVIDIPPGTYRITDPGSLLGDETMTEKGVGLRFRGSGKTITNLIFAPATANAMATNDYWQGLEFHDIGFRTAVAGCTFLRSYTNNSAQRYMFRSCEWEGWKYGVDLQGSDNNSEFTFLDCHTLFHQNDGAFFYVGTTGNTAAADQFLNYWFYGCTHWGTSAPYIDAAYSGSFHIFGLDVSAWGQALTGAKALFNLRGASHSLGVCNFQANGVRVEAMNAQAQLLYSEWPQGNVAFRNVDWSSQSSTYTYGDVISINYLNVGGAIYSFTDSNLSGGVRVKFGPNDWGNIHRIELRNCGWTQRNSPSDVVSYDTSGASGNIYQLPPVEFIGCRGPNNDVTSATGAAVWDATIGYRGELLQSLEPRAVSVRGILGVPATGTTLTFTLPVGALITGLQALSPVSGGGNTEADGGTWTLRTTEGTPATVAAVTIPGALSAGYDVTTALTIPFHCNTAARAKLTISATNVAQWNSDALLLVKGYW